MTTDTIVEALVSKGQLLKPYFFSEDELREAIRLARPEWVSKTEAEVRARRDEAVKQLAEWKAEATKTNRQPVEVRDEGYLIHCRELVTMFQTEVAMCDWILPPNPTS